MTSIPRNILWLSGADAARRVIGFAAVALLARKAGPAGFGAVTIGFTVLSYALALSSAGLPSFGARAVARGEGGSVVSDVLSARLVNALLSSAIMCGVGLSLPDRAAGGLIMLFSISLALQSALPDWYYQGLERMGLVSAGRLLSSAVYLAVIAAMVSSPADITWVALGSAAGDAACCALLLAGLRKEGILISLNPSRARWVSIMRSSFPLGAGSLLAHFSASIAPLAVGILMTNRDVGIIGAALKLVVFLMILDRAVASVLLPASARLRAVSPELLERSLSLALKWIIIVALPLCVGGSVLAADIVPLVFGPGYGESTAVFRVLVWFLLFTMAHTVYVSGLVAADRERDYGRVMAAGAAIAAVSVFLCTWLAGAAGAAAAMVGAEAVTLALAVRAFSKHARLRPGRPAVAAGLSAAGMGGALLLLPRVPLPAAAAAGAVLYAGLLFLTRGVTAGDVALILKRV